MKTAISIPDETFEEVARRAAALGMSRSEFFLTAARRFLADLDDEAVTEQINALLGDSPAPDRSSSDAVELGRRRLAGEDDGW